MVKTLTISRMLRYASNVGITLRRCEVDEANLYTWATPEDEVLYIGKAASPQRIKEEERWAKQDHRSSIMSGIVPLIRENNASNHPFRYDLDTDFDADRVRAVITEQRWEGPAFTYLTTWLNDDNRLGAGEPVERFLIRLAVRAGAPIGNSRNAAQWESPIGAIEDTLAVLAVYYDPL